MRRIGALLAASALVLLTAPPAVAIEPPVIDAAAVPPDETGPDQPTEQRRVCSAPIMFPNSNFTDKPWANDYLRIADAQKFALRGPKGTVAPHFDEDSKDAEVEAVEFAAPLPERAREFLRRWGR